MQGVGGHNGAGAHGGDSVRDQVPASGIRAAATARRGVGLLALLVLLAVPASAPVAAGAAEPSASSASSAKRAKAHAKRRAAARAVERRRLHRALRRNPKRALRGDFLRRAAIAGLRMPVTVRFRAGETELGVTWAPTRFPLDQAQFPAPAGEQVLTLAGNFPMTIDFGAGPGYGGIGNIQARSGPGGNITAEGPLTIAELAACVGTPPPFAEAATSTTAGAPIVAAAATQTWVDLNPFTGYSDGYLDLKLSIRSRILGSGATCATPGASADYDVPVTTPDTDPWNMPVRVRWDGSFRVAPAILADGAVRFGKMTVDGATQPQLATTGNLWGCVAEAVMTGSGLPTGTACTSASPLGEPVGPAPFPASMIFKKLSADILLGDRN